MIPTLSMRRPAVLAVLVCTAQAPAPATSPLPWCISVPLPRAAQSCRALELRVGSRMLRLAVASTEAQREHGLMNVPVVPAGQGMLFAFAGGDGQRYFWMKDTIAPLDMIFVRSDGTISAVAANVPATAPGMPDDDVARRAGIGRYVIELGAGEAALDGIVPGMRLVVPPVAAQ